MTKRSDASPEITVQNELSKSPEEVWAFVKDMNQWAPLLTGYVSHQIESETRSLWTLRGDAGVMTRTVVLEVNIVEWNGPERVRFTLKGQGEAVEGSGIFEIQAANDDTTTQPAALTVQPWWHRLLAWASSLFVPKKAHPDVPSLGSAARSILVYRLQMSALGPTAPMVNAMLTPWIQQSTSDLAARIVAHLEQEAPATQ